MATFALADGVDAVSVAAILGHKGPRTTLASYAHVIDKSAAHAVETVGSKFASAMLAKKADRCNRLT
jgi:site-specific recombinase XerD